MPTPNYRHIITCIDRALREMPFLEDIEQGSQEVRDLITIRNRLVAAKTRAISRITLNEAKARIGL